MASEKHYTSDADKAYVNKAADVIVRHWCYSLAFQAFESSSITALLACVSSRKVCHLKKLKVPSGQSIRVFGFYFPSTYRFVFLLFSCLHCASWGCAQEAFKVKRQKNKLQINSQIKRYHYKMCASCFHTKQRGKKKHSFCVFIVVTNADRVEINAQRKHAQLFWEKGNHLL